MRAWINAADKAAIGLSILCTVQCLLLPVILVLVPAVSGVLAFDDELFHRWLLFAVLPISLFAVISGYFHHRRIVALLVSGIGMALLLFAVVEGHDRLGELGEVVVTVIGSLFVACGHFVNLKWRSRHPKLEPESS